MDRGGASHPPVAAASAVVAPLPCPNVPPNLHPGNGNAVAYDLWLDCATARILSLDAWLMRWREIMMMNAMIAFAKRDARGYPFPL